MDNLRTLVAELESTEFDTKDVQILGVRGHERISQLFWFELDVVMRRGLPLPEDAGPGAAVTIVLRYVGGLLPEERRIHGILESVRDLLDENVKHRTYLLRVVPELARLRLVETQEIFLGRTVPEIIAHKLGLHDLADAKRLRMDATDYPKRDFVVQYKESDLAFVSRLAEHVGMSFVFEHGEEGPARVTFTDDVSHHGLQGAPDAMAFHTGGEHDGVFALTIERRMMSSTYLVQDYNYRTPLAEISGAHQLEKDGKRLGNGGGIIEYGTHHKDKPEGDQLAQIRAEERLSSYEVYAGKSIVAGLTAGATPTLTGHPFLADRRLLIVEIDHRASFAVEGATEGATPHYENTFEAISADVRYRPPRVTPRPRIHGLVTGTVALGQGEVGGAAQIDEEGRYVIQLHFDTVVHEGEEKASHATRMSQPFAGPNHGMHFPLRPGAEVVVAFLDGDPDRPIILGSVPNAINRSTTTVANANKNRITSASGVLFEFADGK